MLLKCASFNVNDCGKTQPKRKSIFYFLKQKNYDIIFLQETHSCFNDEKLWQYEWGGKLFFSHGENNSKGVTILIKQSLKIAFGNVNIDPIGRYCFAEIKINNKSLVIGSIYASTKDEPAFFDSLFSVITNFSHTDLILAGDWNVVLNDTLDKDGDPPYVNRNSKEKTKSYMDFFNLRNVFRDFNPPKKYLREFKPSPTRRHDWIFF